MEKSVVRGGTEQTTPIDDKCEECWMEWHDHFRHCMPWNDFCSKNKSPDDVWRETKRSVRLSQQQGGGASRFDADGVSGQVTKSISVQRSCIVLSERELKATLKMPRLPKKSSRRYQRWWCPPRTAAVTRRSIASATQTGRGVWHT